MTNLFMKVNKDLFKLGLNPTEILILAQVMEFNTNTGNCFISDKVLAEQFGVSEKTISRTIKGLEDKGLLTRNTQNVKGGKTRYMSANLAAINAALPKEQTKDNLSVVNTNNGQNDCCTKDKLSVVKGQNDLIKDNIIDNILKEKKEEDNMDLAPVALNPKALTAKAVKPLESYPAISVAQLTSNNIEYELIQDSRNLIRIKATGAIARVV